MATRKRIVLTLCGLCLLGLFSLVGLHAGELASLVSDESTLFAPPSPLPSPPLNVAEVNKDSNGHIRVHEQGTVRVVGTVDVGNQPTTQDVRVVNGGGGSVKLFEETIQEFEETITEEFDISEFSKVRIMTGVNGVGSATFTLQTDAGILEVFDMTPGHVVSTSFTDTPGTKLFLRVESAEGPQIVLRVFGGK